MSERPEAVVIRTPLETPDQFYETVLTPEEARRYALDLLNDAERAIRVQETAAWLLKSKT
jgi:hypothetical protein